MAMRQEEELLDRGFHFPEDLRYVLLLGTEATMERVRENRPAFHGRELPQVTREDDVQATKRSAVSA